MTLNVDGLRQFPQKEWKEEATPRWEKLCTQLHDYTPPMARLKVAHLERKWEIVSAYQKCVRRGMGEQALWLVGGWLTSFDRKESRYFWRRVCTTAAEDIGYADPELMNFVVACSTLYSSMKTELPQMYQVWCFLTEQMCGGPKSRIYCQLSIIENLIKQGLAVPDLTEDQEKMVKDVAIPTWNQQTEKYVWSLKNNWRGEGMLKYQQWQLQTIPSDDAAFLTEPVTLKGLPDFAYDMHTRVGKVVVIRLTGRKPFKDWLVEHQITGDKKQKAIGYALFFMEGGLIPGGLEYGPLSALEQKYVAADWGAPVDDWKDLQNSLLDALQTGQVNDLRVKTLDQQTY
jgi:hypothetical protein